MATKTTKAPKAEAPTPIGVTAEGRPRFEAPRIVERRSSFCDTARKIEADVIGSSVDAAGWRDLCPIVVIDGKGTVHRCSDEHHTNHTACTWCGQDGKTELDPVYLRCVDTNACKVTRAERVAETKRARKILEWDALTAVEKAKRPDPVDEDGAPKPKRVKGEARPTSGRCHHCGEPTKGGRFVIGHDAKLKGLLKRAALDGIAMAVTEMIARGWLKRPGDYDPAVVAEGRTIAEAHPEHRIIETCTMTRLRRIEEGMDPMHAVREATGDALVMLTSEEQS
jgi:hypothetical protein